MCRIDKSLLMGKLVFYKLHMNNQSSFNFLPFDCQKSSFYTVPHLSEKITNFPLVKQDDEKILFCWQYLNFLVPLLNTNEKKQQNKLEDIFAPYLVWQTCSIQILSNILSIVNSRVQFMKNNFYIIFPLILFQKGLLLLYLIYLRKYIDIYEAQL